MTHEDKNLFESLAHLLDDGIDPMTREDELWQRYGRTVAVLMLDSSGFSRVSESHGILHFLTRLMQMRQAITPIFEEHQSLSVHFEADNVFAVFEDVDDAILCARAIHACIFDAGIMLTEFERFEVCIGVGYGNMLYSETLEGYFSEEMNFSSKLGEDTANGNETLITAAAYEQASDSVVVDFVSKNILVSGVELSYFYHRFQGDD